MLVLPTNFVYRDGSLHIDTDFAANLQVFLEYFHTISIYSHVSDPANDGMLVSVTPFSSIPNASRIEFVELPHPYREDRYLAAYKHVETTLRKGFAKASVVQCTPHAPFDWPTLAANVLMRENIPFAIQSDWDKWVTTKGIYTDIANPIRRFRKFLHARIFLRQYRRILSRTSVALLHGNDVYEGSKHLTPNPQLIHNPSVTADDQISNAALEAKKTAAREGNPLRITYAGRTEPMKGPLEWLETLRAVRDDGVAFDAMWFGTGSLEATYLDQLRELGLQDCVTYGGKVTREVIYDRLYRTDIFLFCHQTRESPRNLIEALACGVPIVGYHSPYAKDLTARHGGSVLHPVGDTRALANTVAELNRDRDRLAELIGEAARSGAQYTREAALAERAELMLEYASITR
ncbi:MAG: glycosyltransferase [Pontixanthobacter sp.]